jgi:hypothetical protein
MNTSFHIGGFWFHVQWDREGSKGRDQRGATWLDYKNPHPEVKLIETICKASHEGINLALKNIIL